MQVRPLLLAFSVAVSLPIGAADAPAPAKAPAAPMKCTSGEVFAGNPKNRDPEQQPKDGTGIKDDPPLGWRSLAFVGNTLFTTNGQEVWSTDISAAKPVQKRVAGFEDRSQSLKAGPCKDARFANPFGIAVLSDGSLVLADQTANAIVHIKDPTSAKCSVEFWAGATKNIDTISPNRPPNQGDVDGPGAAAKFGLPIWPVTGEKDTVYFIDSGNKKLKSVTSDGTHTVKTVAKLGDEVWNALVWLNGKLYMHGNNFKSEAFIVEVDPATGAMREVIKGRPDAFLSENGSNNPSGLTTDGKGLIGWQSGILFYVTTEGKVFKLAGDGNYFNYAGGYDPLVPHKAEELQLVASRRHLTAGTSVFLTYKDGNVYLSASSDNAYVEKISCK